jgi:hypothetical protein
MKTKKPAQKTRNQHRTISTRHKARVHRKATHIRRKRQTNPSEVLGVVLAGSGWDPTAVASAIAAIGSNDTSSMDGAMQVTGGQLVLLWIDEPQKPVRSPYASMTKPTQSSHPIPREDVIATD